ncbi:ribonuclease P protein subunit p38 [Megalops cyprinoides]|uniref:ribonuclease P protein subunit p38 n=1 Tax=Megalops cyprinoides TaxID=118141 RepID=UPI0018646D73|nr:ribonuclease P protein subunit p38 [Megalops cyprinoides]
MTASAKGAKKEKKKPIPVKTSLNSPYSLQWSPMGSEDMHFILSALKEKISEIGLQKREGVKDNRKWGKKKKQPSDKPPDEPREKADTEGGTPPKRTEQGWTDMAARKQLAIGINEVTRALERNELCLVLVCKSVKPRHMTSHLIALSETRAVPACQVPRLSESMSRLLGLKCVLALGFKRNTDTFSQTVSAIVPKVPRCHVPWIAAQAEAPSVGDDSVSEGQRDETENRNETKAQKRKIVEASPETVELKNASPFPLQPLRVKKIIPNPSKIRKQKKKKVAK